MSDQKASRGWMAICAERIRQMGDEGFTGDHDDGLFPLYALAYAAQRYELAATGEDESSSRATARKALWPFKERMWKPTKSPIRNLEKAGALYLAQSARHLRAMDKTTSLEDYHCHDANRACYYKEAKRVADWIDALLEIVN